MVRRVRALGPGEIEEVLAPSPWLSKPSKTPRTAVPRKSCKLSETTTLTATTTQSQTQTSASSSCGVDWFLDPTNLGICWQMEKEAGEARKEAERAEGAATAAKHRSMNRAAKQQTSPESLAEFFFS